jgi:hypothetical protein
MLSLLASASKHSLRSSLEKEASDASWHVPQPARSS